MIPNELKEYIDSAINQRDNVTLVYFIMVPIISLLASFFVSYMTEKGKNSATKEDVGQITMKIESSKAHFTERLEHVKSDLTSRVHYGRIRYERETKVFEEVWAKLCDLREAVLSLRPGIDPPPGPEETPETRKKDRLGKLAETVKALDRTVQRSRPFYPPTIWEELRRLLDPCCEEWWDFASSDIRNGFKDYWNKAMENCQAINVQVDRTCEAIRSRLTHFDAA